MNRRRAPSQAFDKAYCNSLLTNTLLSRSNKFANISENLVLANISGFTVFCINVFCIFKISFLTSKSRGTHSFKTTTAEAEGDVTAV